MNEQITPKPSPLIIVDRIARECERCYALATVQYVHTCGRVTFLCERHRREHEVRTDPAYALPASCVTCGLPAPWPVPWSAVVV